MIKNKIMKKIGMSVAVVALLSTGIISATVPAVSAAEQEECTFNVDSLTGDYVTLNPTNYNLDCKNQGTVGKPITFKTSLTGYGMAIGYTYSLSNKAVARPADVFGPYACDTFTWTPTTQGLYSVRVACKDCNGNTKYGNQYVEINAPLAIDSFTSDHPYSAGEFQGRAKFGETINLEAVVSGGYKYTNKKYTYSIIPRSATSTNRTITYYNLPSSELAWTPKYPGIYCVDLLVTDDIGNSETKSLYFLIEN